MGSMCVLYAACVFPKIHIWGTILRSNYRTKKMNRNNPKGQLISEAIFLGFKLGQIKKIMAYYYNITNYHSER